MSKLTGAALDRAVANAMGLKSVNNCEQWGKEMTEDDNDIQEYKKPWVGLTDDEIWESDSYKIAITDQETRWLYRFAKDIEAKLKEKNT